MHVQPGTSPIIVRDCWKGGEGEREDKGRKVEQAEQEARGCREGEKRLLFSNDTETWGELNATELVVRRGEGGGKRTNLIDQDDYCSGKYPSKKRGPSLGGKTEGGMTCSKSSRCSR